MDKIEEVFEELITTITSNVVDGKVSISNVDLFLKSWRAEFKHAKEQDSETIATKLETIQGEVEKISCEHCSEQFKNERDLEAHQFNNNYCKSF